MWPRQLASRSGMALRGPRHARHFSASRSFSTPEPSPPPTAVPRAESQAKPAGAPKAKPATKPTVEPTPPPAVSPAMQTLFKKHAELRRVLGPSRRLTLAEKILYSHIDDVATGLGYASKHDIRGSAPLHLKPDRVNMQDASAQMALLQFMSCDLPQTAVPASIHCDHLIVGEKGADDDLASGVAENQEVFGFLESAARKYGIDFWPPGAGIIHQTVLENYAVPGLMMLGTDSHSPNAGGLCTMTIGVGGADAVEAMVGASWMLRAPRIMGVRLTGRLSEWVSPKDLILHLAGRLTVRGGTGFVIEYFGPGVETFSLTGMATVCNMGAELGATTSIFPYTQASARYLQSTRRQKAREEADAMQAAGFTFRADEGAEYDQLIEVDLSELEPRLNGPFTPDLSTSLSGFKETVQQEQWPEKLSAALIGSCTNSSYEDMTRAESLVKAATAAGLRPAVDLYVTPGSEQIRATLERDGVLDTFNQAGAVVLSNACGPCIGQWKRRDEVEKGTPNAILTSYNRNFRGRNDGNPETMNFLASPELVTAFAYAGMTTFNPVTDSLTTPDGKEFRFPAPKGREGPETPFEEGREAFKPLASAAPDPSVEVAISPTSDRLARLEPFPMTPPGANKYSTYVLVKVAGKCTTDTISAAGPWLKYKGHLPNISANTLNTAVNAETGGVNEAFDLRAPPGTAAGWTRPASSEVEKHTIADLARRWRDEGATWVVVAEHNYGEGSAREHAALQPRYLGCRAVIAKSFARIHETNLKKQGVIPLTLANEADYDRFKAGQQIFIYGRSRAIWGSHRGSKQVTIFDPSLAKTTLSEEEIVEQLAPLKGADRRAFLEQHRGFFNIKVECSLTREEAAYILAGSALNWRSGRRAADGKRWVKSTPALRRKTASGYRQYIWANPDDLAAGDGPEAGREKIAPSRP